jgi:hypothetical protein
MHMSMISEDFETVSGNGISVHRTGGLHVRRLTESLIG